MNSDEATAAIIDALNSSGIPYMLVGSFSSNYYGVPRLTQDADFVLQLQGRSIASVVDQLDRRFRLDPQISFETVTATTRYVLEVRDTLFKIEFFLLSDDPHDQQRLARRRPVRMLGREVFVPTAEDVVITKLRWSDSRRQSKDIDDVKNVISVRGDRIDWDYVNLWCERHGTREILEEVRRSIPPI